MGFSSVLSASFQLLRLRCRISTFRFLRPLSSTWVQGSEKFPQVSCPLLNSSRHNVCHFASGAMEVMFGSTCRDLPSEMAGEDKRIKWPDSKLRCYSALTFIELACALMLHGLTIDGSPELQSESRVEKKPEPKTGGLNRRQFVGGAVVASAATALTASTIMAIS